MIVDTHTHVVAADEGRYPLSPRDLSGAWYREAPHSAEQLLALMDAAGVDHAVLVQPVGAYSFDNRYVADAAAAHPDRLVAACSVDIEGDDPAAELRGQVEERGVRGVRLFALSRDPRSWLAEERARSLWETAVSLELQVIVTILPHQLDELEEALALHPDASVSLDHCAFATPADLEPLVRHPGLHLKLTPHVLDAATRADDDPSLRVEALVERFGAERIMWGSDFCQTHDRSYGERVAQAEHALRRLSDADRAMCLGGVARRLWSL